jgi:hypothetical protein
LGQLLALKHNNGAPFQRGFLHVNYGVMTMSYENVPDGYRDPVWNEKPQHPGDVFELAEKGDLDALGHIGEHAVVWLNSEIVAMCLRELAIKNVKCAAMVEELDRLLIDCIPVGIRWIGGDSWLCEVAREAIGESLFGNASGRDIARLLTACAQAGKGKLSPEFPRDDFDYWQDMCQQDWMDKA